MGEEHRLPGGFRDGKILGLAVQIGKKQYVDMKQEAAALVAVD